MVIPATSLTSSLSMGQASNSISKFTFLQKLFVSAKPPKPIQIKQVTWFPHACGFIKCNTDGAASSSPGHVAGGGIFHDSFGVFHGCFAAYIGVKSALHAEHFAAILAIEYAHSVGCDKLW